MALKLTKSLTSESTFEYNKLKKDQIRLLYLLEATDENAPLQGELLTYSLTEALDADEAAPRYEALSYTWGNCFVESRQRGPERTSPRLNDVKATMHKHPTIEIVKVNGDEDRTLLGTVVISRNLESALLSFRKGLDPDQPLLLWVDAICIDQSSASSKYEKAHQIQRMAEIYSQAAKVRVWLGNEGEGSETAFDFIKTILAYQDLESYRQQTGRAVEWKTFRDLMQRSWFRRRWIVQEIAFSRQAEVYCGEAKMSWSQLSSAISLFASMSDDLQQLFKEASDFDNNADYLGEIDAYGAKSLVDTIGRMFRRTTDHLVLEQLLPLESVLTNLTAFETGRPHDYIFAVMRLSSDARPVSLNTLPEAEKFQANTPPPPANAHPDRDKSQFSTPPPSTITYPHGNRLPRETSGNGLRGRPLYDRKDTAQYLKGDRSGQSMVRAKEEAESNHRKRLEDFVVDYEKPIFDLCSEVIGFIVRRTKSLDMICKPWAPPPDVTSDPDFITMPSWIQTLDKKRFGANSDCRSYSRVAADPLVGTQLHESLGPKPYSASGRTSANQKFFPDDLITDRILHATGFELDTVSKFGRPAGEAAIPANWLKLVDWDVDRVVAATDDQPGMTAPPENFWRTMVGNRASSNGPELPPEHWRYACRHIFTERPVNGSLNIGDLLRRRAFASVVPFLRRLRAVIWDRALILTAGRGNDSKGFLGLAPGGVQVGDKICILQGCSVPVVLRPKVRKGVLGVLPSQERPGRRQFTPSGTPSRDNSCMSEACSPLTWSATTLAESGDESLEQEYSLIGECYIHEMMDGEAFYVQKTHNIPLEDYHIGCAAECNCQRCEPQKWSQRRAGSIFG